MRVLLIDVNCKSSSTGQIVYNLYTYLNSHGDEAAVCYGRGELIKEKNIFKFGLDWETNVHALLTRITGYTGCFSYFSTQRLIKYIEDFKPDVVHIHELHAYFVNIKQLLEYLAEKRIKVIHTLHCEFSYTGKCGHSVECEKWKTECGKCPHLREYPATLWFDQTTKMYRSKRSAFSKLTNAIYVAPSKWLYERMTLSFLGNQNIKLIHNSIDTDIFSPNDVEILRKDIGIEEDQKVVLAVAPGIMSENKGGRYVLEIASKLQEVVFIMIGSDEEPYQRDNVRNLGRIYDKGLLSKYYSLADAFLICSKNENFPTTCVEAVCCGTPVIGFDAGGAKETAPYGTGTFVEYGNVDALIECLSSSLRNQVNHKMFEQMREHYSITRMCDEYYQLYQGD